MYLGGLRVYGFTKCLPSLCTANEILFFIIQAILVLCTVFLAHASKQTLSLLSFMSVAILLLIPSDFLCLSIFLSLDAMILYQYLSFRLIINPISKLGCIFFLEQKMCGLMHRENASLLYLHCMCCFVRE